MDTWYSIEVALENGRKKMDCSVNGNRTHGQYMRGKNDIRSPTSRNTKINCRWIKDLNVKGRLSCKLLEDKIWLSSWSWNRKSFLQDTEITNLFLYEKVINFIILKLRAFKTIKLKENSNSEKIPAKYKIGKGQNTKRIPTKKNSRGGGRQSNRKMKHINWNWHLKRQSTWAKNKSW